MIDTIFLQKDKTYTINNTVNIILSPELYWVRVFSIPISSKKDALHSLPSLFEDFIDTDGYKFYIIKLEEHKYLGFAYNEDEIKEILKNSNIPLRKVQGLYFAQNEFQSFFEDQSQMVFEVLETQLTYQNDILVQLPQNFHQENTKKIEINSITLSKEYIILNNYSKFISDKAALALSLMVFILSISVFVKSYIIKQQQSKYEETIEVIKTKNALPPTLFQMRSIVQNFDQTEKKYSILRQALYNVSSFKLPKNGKLKTITLTQKKVIVDYENIELKILQNYFNKYYKDIKYGSNRSKKTVEIQL